MIQEQQLGINMKKLLTIIAVFAAIACKAQTDTLHQSFLQFPTALPMDGQAYTPVIINGIPTWLIASYFERQIDTNGTTPMVIARDTIKTVGTYWISGYVNQVSGNQVLQWYCAYTNEAGQSRSIASPVISSGDSNFSPVEKRLGAGVVTIQVLVRSGAGRWDGGCRIRKVR